MALGMFIFETRSVSYQELKRITEWRHASQSRLGERPAYQFIGQGTDTINLSGTLLPTFTGGRFSLDEIREMADQGNAWSLAPVVSTAYGSSPALKKPAATFSGTVPLKRLSLISRSSTLMTSEPT